jgi:hypothetical protein
MNPLLKSFRNASKASNTIAGRFRPAPPMLEQLEDRQLLSVTLHSPYAPMLANVEVDPIFYGSQWYTDPQLQAQANQLDGFLNFITQSSYMDMLSEYSTNYYQIGRGSLENGMFITDQLPGQISDGQIQNMIDYVLHANWLAPPDGNRLYFVFTAPGVSVARGGEIGPGPGGFLGYHDSFSDAQFGTAYYAVVTYTAIPGFNAFQTMTECSSHELAEAVTDPDLQTGWFDGDASHEIGDLANLVLGVQNGYVVQAEWLNSLNGPGLPWDAQWLGGAASNVADPAQTISNPLENDGQHGLTEVALANRNTHGIDNTGNAMVELLSTNGDANQDRSGSGWTSVTTHHKARAALVDVVFSSGDAMGQASAGRSQLMPG